MRMGWMRHENAADGGFTLVELMVAIGVFLIASTASISLILTASTVIRDNADRVYAANLANSEIDRMRDLGPSAITIGQVTTQHSSTQGEFTVSTTSNWVGLNQVADSCSTATPGQAYMRVHVEVTGEDLGAPQVSDTLVAPPDDAPAAAVGSVAVKVVDALDEPVSGITVSGRDLVGGSTFSYVTGPDGCIFVPNLTPSASWQLSVARTGFVGSPDSPTTQVKQVLVGQSTPVTFEYAEAASLTFAAPTDEFLIPASMPVSLAMDASSVSTVTPGAFPATTGSLWPSPAGYQAWLGSCNDADPASAISPRTTSVPRSAFETPAGGSTRASLQGAAVKVRGLLAGTTVRVRHAAEATGRCLSAQTYDIGTTTAKGIVRAYLPYGRWTVMAPGTPDITVVLDPSEPEPVVSFPLANLDIPCPSPEPSPSESVFPPSPAPSPSPTLPCEVTP